MPNVARTGASGAVEGSHFFGAIGYAKFGRADLSYVGDSFTKFQDLAMAAPGPLITSVNTTIGLSLRKWAALFYSKNQTKWLIATGVDTVRVVPATYPAALPRTMGVELAMKY